MKTGLLLPNGADAPVSFMLTDSPNRFRLGVDYMGSLTV
jgi:hypothetical protein